MNKTLTAFIAAILFLVSVPAFADLQISNNGTRAGQFRKINLPSNASIAANGDITINPVIGAAAITSGTIAGVAINTSSVGATTPSTGNFTTLGTVTTALTPGSNVAVNCALGGTFTLTPGQAESITATGMVAGQRVHLIILTSGTSSYTLTFSTGFKTTGTLASGTADAKVFVVSFVSDGTTLYEVSRTTAM